MISQAKLAMYKTAYSPTYESFIEIVKVRYDDMGEAIIHGRIPGREDHVLFRVCELEKFCL